MSASRATPSTRVIVAALLVVYIVWGSTYFAIRVAIDTMPPLLMASARFLIAGGLVFAWTSMRGGGVPRQRLTLQHWRSAAVIGIALLGLGNGGVTLGEEYVPSGIAALLVATVPLWMVVFSAAFERRVPRALAAIGVAVGLCGTALLLRPGAVVGTSPLRMLLVLIAPLCWSTGSLWSRRAPLPSRPLVATSMEMVCGGAVLLVAGLARGEGSAVHLEAMTLRSLAAFVYLIIFGSLLAYTAYVWLLRNASSTLVSTYAYVNPLVAVLLGSAFLGEVITTQTLIAGGIIALAVALIVASPPPRGRALPQHDTAPEAA